MWCNCFFLGLCVYFNKDNYTSCVGDITLKNYHWSFLVYHTSLQLLNLCGMKRSPRDRVWKTGQLVTIVMWDDLMTSEWRSPREKQPVFLCSLSVCVWYCSWWVPQVLTTYNNGTQKPFKVYHKLCWLFCFFGWTV